MINSTRVGKWINDDGTIGEPDPSNSYRYVGNSPLNYTDANGLYKKNTTYIPVGHSDATYKAAVTFANGEDGKNANGFVAGICCWAGGNLPIDRRLGDANLKVIRDVPVMPANVWRPNDYLVTASDRLRRADDQHDADTTGKGNFAFGYLKPQQQASWPKRNRESMNKREDFATFQSETQLKYQGVMQDFVASIIQHAVNQMSKTKACDWQIKFDFIKPGWFDPSNTITANNFYADVFPSLKSGITLPNSNITATHKLSGNTIEIDLKSKDVPRTNNSPFVLQGTLGRK